MFILFDTNVINNINPRSPRADVVRALRASGAHKVGITGTALEELAAHQAKDYMVQRQAAVSQLNSLRRKMRWQPAVAFEEPRLELEECLEYWRAVYSELFEVLPASGDVALKALAREALALPPAKQGPKRAEGARDAAIWFTILDYLRQHPDEEVHFVTDNTTDFGDGATYRFPMDQDLGDDAARLKRLTTFDDVVTAFTELVTGDAAFAEAEHHLGSEAVAAEIGKLALAQRAVVGFPGVDSTGEAVEWKGWLGPPSVALLRTGSVVGHRIGERVWYTAEPTWLLFGTAGTCDGKLENVSCIWKIKLLFPVGDGGRGEDLTLLSADDPTAPDLRDGPTVDAVQALRAKAIKEIVAARKPVGGAGSSDTAEVRRELGPALSAQLDTALLADAVSRATAAVIPQNELAVARLAEAMRVGFEPVVASGLLESVRTSLESPAWAEAFKALTASLSAYDFSMAPVLEKLSRIDIASTLPTYSVPAYSLASALAAANHDCPHEDDAKDEADGESGRTPESRGVEADDAGNEG